MFLIWYDAIQYACVGNKQNEIDKTCRMEKMFNRWFKEKKYIHNLRYTLNGDLAEILSNAIKVYICRTIHLKTSVHRFNF